MEKTCLKSHESKSEIVLTNCVGLNNIAWRQSYAKIYDLLSRENEIRLCEQAANRLTT